MKSFLYDLLNLFGEWWISLSFCHEFCNIVIFFFFSFVYEFINSTYLFKKQLLNSFCMWWFCVYFIIFYASFYYLLLLTGFEIWSLFFQRFIITSFIWDLLFCKLSTYFSNFPLSTALAVSIPMTCCALIFQLIPAMFSFSMISSMTSYLFQKYILLSNYLSHF